MDYTTQQKQALINLKSRWSYVGKPYPMLGGNGCLLVDVSTSKEGRTITLGIELNGIIGS